MKKVLGFWAGSQAYREAARKKEGSLAAMADPDTLATMFASSPWKKSGHGMLSDMVRISKLRRAFGQEPARR